MKPISTTAQEMVEQAQDAIEEAASVAKSALTEAAGAVKRGVRVHKKEETKDEKMKRLANTQGEIVEIAGREEEAKTEIERLLAEKAKVNAKLATEAAKVTKLAREVEAANLDKTRVDTAIASQKHVQDRIALTTALLTETQPALDALERHVNELKKAVADHAKNVKNIK
jgi:chromosome segregation ATPase